jgi:hypothetical protein
VTAPPVWPVRGPGNAGLFLCPHWHTLRKGDLGLRWRGYHLGASWVGSLWRLAGAKGPVVGRVHAVQGPMVTLEVVGLDGQGPDGVAVIPTRDGGGQFARVSAGVLLGRWTRVEGGLP